MLDALPPRLGLLADERLETAPVRLGVDEIDPRQIAVDEVDRPGFPRAGLVIGRNDPRHGGLDSRALMRIEERVLAHGLFSLSGAPPRISMATTCVLAVRRPERLGRSGGTVRRAFVQAAAMLRLMKARLLAAPAAGSGQASSSAAIQPL